MKPVGRDRHHVSCIPREQTVTCTHIMPCGRSGLLVYLQSCGLPKLLQLALGAVGSLVR